ncbi:unnamed protein product, partial [Mycena citricolor]
GPEHAVISGSARRSPRSLLRVRRSFVPDRFLFAPLASLSRTILLVLLVQNTLILILILSVPTGSPDLREAAPKHPQGILVGGARRTMTSYISIPIPTAVVLSTVNSFLAPPGPSSSFRFEAAIVALCIILFIGLIGALQCMHNSWRQARQRRHFSEDLERQRLMHEYLCLERQADAWKDAPCPPYEPSPPAYLAEAPESWTSSRPVELLH